MTHGSSTPVPSRRAEPRTSAVVSCDVVLRELSLREGLQAVRRFVPTDAKLRWCRAIAAAGVREFEAGDLVPEGNLSQFRDAPAVLASAKQLDGVLPSVVVADLAAARSAVELTAAKLMVVVSAGEAFSHAQLGRGRAERLADFREIVALARAAAPAARPQVGARVAVAFGCALQGDIPLRDVVRTVDALVEAGADEITLADTAGGAYPAQVRDVLVGVLPCLGGTPLTLHFQDIRGLGLGLANCLAGFEGGVRRFDTALGGVGGCPQVPDPSGNVATEDLVFMLDWMGLSTGIDPEGLVEAQAAMDAALPRRAGTGASQRRRRASRRAAQPPGQPRQDEPGLSP